MKTELQNKIYEKYPEFFDYLKDNKGPLIPMSFGIECGDGWYFILDNLMDNIQSYIKNNSKHTRFKNTYIRKLYIKLNKFRYSISNKKIFKKYLKFIPKLIKNIDKYIDNKFEKEKYETISPIQVTQIKEKYGELCFYYNGGDKMIDGMVWFAESLSGHICETCGTTENVYQTKGWIYTTCKKCDPTKK